MRALLSTLLFAACLMGITQPVWAIDWNPFNNDGDNPVETHLPPPANALETDCEPIRKKINAIYKKPFGIRQLYLPRREYLIAKHRRCRADLAEQEYDYLKHIDVSQPPSLRPLEDEETGLKIPPDTAE